MVYQFKQASRIRVDAQATGELCEKLERTGGLTPHRLVEASRKPGTLLHNEFEWNDGIAAEKYREEQARFIIRSIVVQPEAEEKKPVRAFFSIATEAMPEKRYESTEIILKDIEKTSYLLEQAKRELIAFKQKYAALNELKSIFDAIEKVV